MFTFSHNHCGPRLGDDLIDYYPVEAEQETLVDEYTSQMVDATVKLVASALAGLGASRPQARSRSLHFCGESPQQPRSGRSHAAGKGGTARRTGRSFRADFDRDPSRRKVAAVLFGYACHPTTLSFLTWCGDYPGFAQVEIERQHPGAMAMFVNTCGGDQNPVPRRKVELCEKYGLMLARGVEEALAGTMSPVSVG